MGRILKITGYLAGAFVLLIVLAAVLLITFVSPARLKPLMASQVMKSTGRELTMDGDMSWTFFPYLGVKTGHAQLGNPDGFEQKTFAEIASATMGVKLMPLLHGQIESSGITFKGVNLNLIKNKQGKGNWNFLPKKSSDVIITSTDSNKTKKANMDLVIAGIDISDSNVTYLDEQTNKTYYIKNLELHAKQINLMHSFPIKMTFDFTADTSSGHVSLTGDAALDLQQQNYSLRHIELAAQVYQNGKKTLDLKNAQGNITLSTDKSILAISHLTIETVQAAKLVLSQVNINARFSDNILNLAPITANLYQGKLDAAAKVNLQSAVPQIALQAKLMNVQAEPLLQDLGGANQKLKITGTGNAELQVTTSGTASPAVLQNLNGKGRLSVMDGTIVGVDLGNMVDSAYALLKKQSMPAAGENKTRFGSLTGTVVIHSGILVNDDFNSDSPRFMTTGKGNIDLLKQKIDYVLQTSVKKRSADQKDDIQDLYGIAIPISISGDLKDPKVRLDSDAIAKAVVAYQVQRVKGNIQEKIQEKIQDKIGEQLQGSAGDLLNGLLKH